MNAFRVSGSASGSCVSGRGPLSRAENELLSNAVNELSEETQVWTKQESLLGRGAQVESRRVNKSRRTSLPCDFQSWVLW